MWYNIMWKINNFLCIDACFLHCVFNISEKKKIQILTFSPAVFTHLKEWMQPLTCVIKSNHPVFPTGPKCSSIGGRGQPDTTRKVLQNGRSVKWHSSRFGASTLQQQQQQETEQQRHTVDPPLTWTGKKTSSTSTLFWDWTSSSCWVCSVWVWCVWVNVSEFLEVVLKLRVECVSVCDSD